MSKLDELMALLIPHERACGDWACGEVGDDVVLASRADLQSAIKAVVEDAERYQFIRSAPQALCFMNTAQALGLDLRKVYVQRPEQLDAVIDAARKPGSAA